VVGGGIGRIGGALGCVAWVAKPWVDVTYVAVAESRVELAWICVCGGGGFWVAAAGAVS
jgi:hypothetical protein